MGNLKISFQKVAASLFLGIGLTAGGCYHIPLSDEPLKPQFTKTTRDPNSIQCKKLFSQLNDAVNNAAKELANLPGRISAYKKADLILTGGNGLAIAI